MGAIIISSTTDLKELSSIMQQNIPVQVLTGIHNILISLLINTGLSPLHHLNQQISRVSNNPSLILVLQFKEDIRGRTKLELPSILLKAMEDSIRAILQCMDRLTL